MLTLLKYVSGPWEQARAYLRQDLDQIETIINTRLASLVGGGSTLAPGAFAGNSSIPTRYVANTGPGNSPMWDLVNLINGVKNRLPFSNIVQTSSGSVLLGRGAGAAGDIQEITLGPSELMDGTQHYDIGGTVAMHALCGGI